MAVGRPRLLSGFRFPHLSNGDKVNSQGCCVKLRKINVELLGNRRIPACGKESRLAPGTASLCEGQVSRDDEVNRMMQAAGK